MALYRIGPCPEAVEAVPTLLKILIDPKEDAKVRKRITWSLRVHKGDLRNMSGLNPALATVVAEARDGRNAMLRYECAFMLTQLRGPEAPAKALDVLLEFLMDPSVRIFDDRNSIPGKEVGTGDGRLMAVQALARVGAPRLHERKDIILHLQKLAEDEVSVADLRQACASLLATLGSNVPELFPNLKQDLAALLRKHNAQNTSAMFRFVSAIYTILSNENKAEHQKAAEILARVRDAFGYIKSEGFKADLRTLLQDATKEYQPALENLVRDRVLRAQDLPAGLLANLPEKLQREFKKAKSAHEESCQKATGKFLQAFDVTIDRVRKSAVIKGEEMQKRIDALKAERQTFARQHTIPFSDSMRKPAMDYLAGRLVAVKSTQKVYDKVIGQLTRVKNDAGAKAVIAERKRVLTPAVVGAWEWSFANVGSFTRILYSDGSTDVDSIRWMLSEDRLEFRQNASVQVVDTCALNWDGQSFSALRKNIQPNNQKNVSGYTGKRIDLTK